MGRMSGAVVVLLLVLVLAFTGCGEGDEPEDDVETTVGPPPTEGAENGPNPPGLYNLGGDRREAYGFLRHIELEGGFWALTDDPPGGSFSGEEIIAVLANTDEMPFDWEANADSYIRVSGVLLEGVSVRMAGPELRVEDVEVVSEFPADAGTTTSG